MAKTETVRAVLPVGRIMYPHIASPDTEGKYGDGKYKCDVFVQASDLTHGHGKDFAEKVLAVATKYYGKAMQFGQFACSVTPTENINSDKLSGLPEEMHKGWVRIRAKSKYAPAIVNHKRQPVSGTDAENIANGDKVILVVSIFPYEQQGGGVAFGLDTVQFIEHKDADEQFGGSSSKGVELLEDIEVKVEDITPETAGGFLAGLGK